MKKIIQCLIVISFLYACKNEPKKQEAESDSVTTIKPEVIEDPTDRLHVFFDGVIKMDANMMLSYADSSGTKRIAGNPIKGKPQMQQRVTFVFPKKVIPPGFKLIFDGENNIDFDKIVLNINNDRIIVKDSAFFEYFKFKPSVQVSEKNIIISKADTLWASESLAERIQNRYSKYK